MFISLRVFARFSRMSHVADVHLRPLQLRLTRDGYLTGNMRMLLPAMRSVLLDPHTG